MGTKIQAGARLHFRTNAKINLFLRVMGRRPDGYHELESIFHGVGLADEVTLTTTSTGRVEVEMTLSAELSGKAPALEENLISHAAQNLLDRGARNEGIRVEVVKHIPIGAGLGGGSGNAAGALIALNELWDLGLDREGLNEIAGLVGSDVPYCLRGGTALATARGENLTALPSPEKMWFVLGISKDLLLTRDVYDAWDRIQSSEEVGSAAMTLALGSGDPAEVASLLHNDLEPAAFSLRPDLKGKKEALLEAGALGAAMTGSGPTVFGIASDETHADQVAAAVKGTFHRMLVVGSNTHCVERFDRP